MKIDFSTHKHLITLLVLLSFFGCDTNPLEIDVSGIEIVLDVKHFEQDLIASEYDLTEDQLKDLQNSYGPISAIVNTGESWKASHDIRVDTASSIIKEI